MQRGSWDQIFARGMGQFVWRYGVVCFGGLLFLTNTPVRWISNNPDLRYDPASVTSLIVISFVYSLCVGAAFCIVAWYAARATYGMTRRSASPSRPMPLRAKSHAAAANK